MEMEMEMEPVIIDFIEATNDDMSCIVEQLTMEQEKIPNRFLKLLQEINE